MGVPTLMTVKGDSGVLVGRGTLFSCSPPKGPTRGQLMPSAHPQGFRCEGAVGPVLKTRKLRLRKLDQGSAPGSRALIFSLSPECLLPSISDPASCPHGCCFPKDLVAPPASLRPTQFQGQYLLVFGGTFISMIYLFFFLTFEEFVHVPGLFLMDFLEFQRVGIGGGGGWSPFSFSQFSLLSCRPPGMGEQPLGSVSCFSGCCSGGFET